MINEFLERYSKEYDFYSKVSQICAEQLESELERTGVRAIVTNRAKRMDRLHGKIKKRSKKKRYNEVSDIYEDITDLAGVRVALYFPGDRLEVDKLIGSTFEIKEKKEFPQSSTPSYNKRFSGYWANHYRVYLKDESLSDVNKKYKNAIIEIQVASVLMHAWSEVEHDLVYKPLSGMLSNEEYAILDELNGLVLSGEIALERLQKASKERLKKSEEKFNNHYELSSYIYDYIKSKNKGRDMEPIMGRADILFKFLQDIDKDKPALINKYIDDLDEDTEKRPVVDQIVDIILEGDMELYEVYTAAQLSTDAKNPYSSSLETGLVVNDKKALNYFISRWITFEAVIREVMINGQKHFLNVGPIPNNKILNKLDIFEYETLIELEKITRLRNQIVHGLALPPDKVLLMAGEFLDKILANLTESLPSELQEDIKSKIIKVV